MQKRFKINFIDLVRPETYNFWSFLDVEKTFLVYQWMASTASGYDGAFELLSGQPTCGGFTRPNGFGANWKESLAVRLQYVLLSGLAKSGAEKWRQKNGISIQNSKIITATYYGPTPPAWLSNITLERYLDSFFLHHGRRLARQLNPFHPEAREVYGLKLHLLPGFQFVLKYGYPNEKNGSEWTFELTLQQKGEPFLDFLKRTEEVLQRELEPKSETAA
ncbi:MAG: hypothetical protein KJ077_10740 [Anaerolineae bacterium]|nr:hypothetical protein [Anaerolineae bacterium]